MHIPSLPRSTTLALAVAAASLLGCEPKPEPAAEPHGSATAAGERPGAEHAPGAAGQLDAKAIAEALGVEGELEPSESGVVKATWPRDAIEVVIDGVALPPAAGLTSWAAFQPMDEGRAMVMGDTVVFQDEVDAAMDAAFAHGLEVTALHNHFFYDTPKVYFMHIGGVAGSQALTDGVGAVWAAIREVRAQRPQPASDFGEGEDVTLGALDTAALAEVIGHPVETKTEGVAKATIGREISMHGHTVGAELGVTTWAAFTGSDALAVIDGDFAMTAAEVQPVLQALREHGLHVVALHNHMIGDEPALYFTHFWGKGAPQELARAFRAGLDAQAGAATP